jgi:DNA-directed RNA polymerase specialized sigma24 family protein
MRQVEHRSYDEIAALLGIEESSAKVLLSRARKWLLEQCSQREQ